MSALVDERSCTPCERCDPVRDPLPGESIYDWATRGGYSLSYYDWHLVLERHFGISELGERNLYENVRIYSGPGRGDG